MKTKKHIKETNAEPLITDNLKTDYWFGRLSSYVLQFTPIPPNSLKRTLEFIKSNRLPKIRFLSDLEKHYIFDDMGVAVYALLYMEKASKAAGINSK